MDERRRVDFLAALGDEFCTALDPVVGLEICSQDGYEVFAKVLGEDFGPEALGLLNDSQIEELRAFGCTWLESPNIVVTFSAVDATAKSATIRQENGDAKLDVADNAKITINGQPGKLAGVPLNQRTSATFALDGKTVL